MFAEWLSRHWWVFVLRGVLAILLGVATFLWPAITLATLVIFFGAYAFVDGVFALVAAFRRERPAPGWLLALEGVIGIGVGVLTLFAPGITALALLLYIAIWAVATGVLEIAAAIALRKEIENEWLLALGGAASLAFGLLLLLRPSAGALAVLWLIGAYAIAFGVLYVLLGLRLHRRPVSAPARV